MSWRVARSLIVLRDQINAAYPDRSRASDGTIGDAAHAASFSDHNPDRYGIVRALDITHDPGHGCVIDQLTDAPVARRDERISYLIANRLITGPEYGWGWASYDGADPHTNHLHLSVVDDQRADDIQPWSIGVSAGDDEQGDSDMAGFIRWIGAAEVFFTDGTRARHMSSEAEMGDIRTLSAEGIYPPVGNSGQVRDVSRRSLIPLVDAPVPAGWEDRAANPPVQVAMTDAQLAAIATQAAVVVGELVDDLQQQVERMSDALGAAGAAQAVLGSQP